MKTTTCHCCGGFVGCRGQRQRRHDYADDRRRCPRCRADIRHHRLGPRHGRLWFWFGSITLADATEWATG